MRNTLIAFGFALLAPVAARAQSSGPSPAPSAAVFEKTLLGTWEGPYQSEQTPPGGLRLSITKQDTLWKATLTVLNDQDMPGSEVTEFKVSGGHISFAQEIMGMTCRANAELVAGTLKGESQCEQGGTVVVTATWVLMRA